MKIADAKIGCEYRLLYWKLGEYIILKDDHFYEENGIAYPLSLNELHRDDWIEILEYDEQKVNFALNEFKTPIVFYCRNCALDQVLYFSFFRKECTVCGSTEDRDIETYENN